MDNTLISLENVSKDFYVYRKNIQRIMGILFDKAPAEVKHALDKVSFEVKRGERLVILGDVDSGRSTLLKVIGRVNYHQRGKLRTYGDICVSLNSKVGVDNNLTCVDNIYNKGNVLGFNRKTMDEHMEEIIKFSNMEGYEKIAIKEAPSGAIALFSLAVHLMVDADIYLIDEVFGGGGTEIREKCERRVIEFFNERSDAAALVVTGSPDFALQFGTRAIVLEEGSVAFDGDVKDALEIFKPKKKK